MKLRRTAFQQILENRRHTQHHHQHAQTLPGRDTIAEGIIGAVKEVGVKIPVVVRLEGNNAELGAKVLAESGLNIIAATSLTDAAQQVVKAAEGK